MSLNQGLYISYGSMKNNQYALSVVAHNIANINTEGYVKQRVNFEESVLYNGDTTVLGTIRSLNGSTLASISDYLDEGALRNVIDSSSDAAYYNTLNDALSGLDEIADALGDNGLNALLNDFYTAAANLEQFPTDISIRQQYIAAAENVCEKFNDISSKLNTSREEMASNVNSSVDTINSLLSKIAEANEAYIKTGKGTSAQSAIYSLVEELSQYADVTTQTNSNGMVSVYLGGIEVVQGAEQQYTLEANIDFNSPDKNVELALRSTENEDYVIDKGITEKVTGGSFGAQVEFLNGSESYYNYDDVEELINSAANDFATALNEIQTYGSEDDADVFAAYLKSDGNGNTVLEKVSADMYDELVMFNTSDGTTTITAGNIRVNQSIIDNPNYVAAARIDLADYTNEDGTISDDWKNAVGNSNNANEIMDLQNRKICDYKGTDCTLSNFLNTLAGKVGQDANDAESQADLYQDIKDEAKTNYLNLIGVNLDEELSDMLRYQRAYEASARLFSTINGLYDTILGMV